MSEERTAQASHADIIRGLREHYDSVSTKACSWASGIGHAIDAYEREPALRKRLVDAEAALGKAMDLVGVLAHAECICQHNKVACDEYCDRLKAVELVAKFPNLSDAVEEKPNVD